MSGLSQCLTRQIKRSAYLFASFLRVAWEQSIDGFQVERDGTKLLGQCVVNLSGKSVALLQASDTGAFFSQPCPLDRDRNMVANRTQEHQLFGIELAPFGSGDVHNAELFLVEIERNAGVK